MVWQPEPRINRKPGAVHGVSQGASQGVSQGMVWSRLRHSIWARLRAPLKSSSASLLCLPCLLLCQCLGGPAGRWTTVVPGDRVVVLYEQGGLRQTLCSGPQFTAREAYSRKGADPGLKVARPEDMQRLLDELGRHGFALRAKPLAPRDIKQLISVEINGQTQVFAMLPKGPERSERDLVDFIGCKQAFVRAFNATTGFSSGNTSAADLQKHQAELRERARQLKPESEGKSDKQ